MDQKTLSQIAHLARLHLSEKEMQMFHSQLTVVFEYFSKIMSFSKSEQFSALVDPLDNLRGESDPMRLDKIENIYSTEELMQLAPERLGQEYLVPPVVE